LLPTRAIHDAAHRLAVATVELFSGCLREEEKVEAYRETYDLAKLHIEHLLLSLAHERRRLCTLQPPQEP
jgi:hypothetical protein